MDELLKKIREFRRAVDDEIKSKYWKNISISLSCIDYAIEKFNNIENPRIAVGYAKLVVMELWTIRELLTSLNINTDEFDNKFVKIKAFRDSYAHIKERIEGIEKPFRQPPRAIEYETESLANGKVTSANGRDWVAKGVQRLFNFEFDGDQGVMSIFGIVDDFLICNSGVGVLELQINNCLSDNLIEVIDNACA